MDTEKYNGWTNYNTWVVGLWLSNEQALYNKARKCTNPQEIIGLVRDEVGDHTGLRGDLLNSALSDVNWDEVFASLHEGDDQ